MADKLPSDKDLAKQAVIVRTYEGKDATKDFQKEAQKLARLGFEVSGQNTVEKHPGMMRRLTRGIGSQKGDTIVVTYKKVMTR